MLGWIIFFVVFCGLLFFDLGFFHKKGQVLSAKKSLILSFVYIAISLIFCGVVYYLKGSVAAQEYLTGYMIEKTLSMDNIFVISLIFTHYSIPNHYQHRVLFWGILAAVILRGILIGLGSVIVQNFSFVLYIFSLFLIYTGIKMLIQKDHEPDIKNNPVLKIVSRFMPVTHELKGEYFFIKDKTTRSNKTVYVATPLFLSLILVEFADLIFALDSVPAIFAITTDPFIVYSSNIFAILGLRSLYFALQAMINRFSYLQTSLSVLLIFIGGKIFAAPIFGIEKIPTAFTLSITVAILGMGILFSLLYKGRR